MKKILKKLLITTFIVIFLVITSFSAFGISYQNKTSILLPYEYYNYQNMTNDLNDLYKENTDIMTMKSLGKTYEGRDIWLIKISDNVDINENEPGVLLMGAHHGNEKPSYESLIFFIKHIISFYRAENSDNDEDGSINEDPIDGLDNDNDGKIDEDPSEDRVRNVINETEIFIVPMVNPDGVEFGDDGWRKNRNPKEGQTDNIGVDLNRNYAYKWELYDIFPAKYGNLWTSQPESWNYRGESPFSEAETTAIKNFVESEKINISLSYHSYGEFISYPWTHTSQVTPNENLFLRIGKGISNINGYELYSGKSTYLPWPGGTIGTSENWLYGEKGVLSYTIELCRTRAPKNSDTVYKYCLTHVGVNLYVCEVASSVDIGKVSISNQLFLFQNVQYLLQKFFNLFV